MGAFSETYAEARTKFLEAAQAAGVAVRSEAHPEHGPDGGTLHTDVAWIGPEDANKVVILISGTHGVEGFFGSAVQIEWLNRKEFERLPKGAAALLIHAINPYGFAWQRRVNEDNVDLNRNWVDFDKPLPAHADYDELAADLCPADWDAAAQQRTGARLTAWMAQRGAQGRVAMQQAVSGGQWKHPQGIFYGGDKPSWSRQILTAILQSRLAPAKRVAILDFHTGLGPYGYAEPIIHRPLDSPDFARTRSWIGAAATSVHGGSVSSEVRGDWISALPGILPRAEIDGVSLECGIRVIDDVFAALRADAWLHAYGDPLGPAAVPIKAMMRNAFHSDDPLWQGMALGQGLAACRAALGGLHQG